jgi:Magnesium chelatase, subunit ChlI C-terminal
MLKTLDGADFATGRARFFDEDANALEGTAKIFVKIEPSNLGFAVLAQLDTGCAWSILKPEIAEAMQLMNEEGQPERLRTRFGNIDGQLKRINISILADDGNSIELEATVFIPHRMDWRKFSGIWRTPRKSTLCGRSTREFFLLWSWRLKERFKQTDLKRLRYNRVLKVSRTIADLSSTEEIQPSHALNYPTKDLNPFLRCSSHKRSWCRDRRSVRGTGRSVQCPPARLCPLRRDCFRGFWAIPQLWRYRSQ